MDKHNTILQKETSLSSDSPFIMGIKRVDVPKLPGPYSYITTPHGADYTTCPLCPANITGMDQLKLTKNNFVEDRDDYIYCEDCGVLFDLVLFLY